MVIEPKFYDRAVSNYELPTPKSCLRAANRLERHGYRTYVQVSREVNRGMNRG
ncbi:MULTISPECIES: hypothetical protein [unclassified Nostoc]|uniref:hypothetical protein n=1 Tax=unclassified Nostoc TaxID=2593658 RepID=UPI001E1A16FB|nr:hypothetical protein [Nostoc sp. JL23]MBN3874892.1 hypothetical protein [Nostoc sp. JL23]